jgi:hypothetical protein
MNSRGERMRKPEETGTVLKSSNRRSTQPKIM